MTVPPMTAQRMIVRVRGGVGGHPRLSACAGEEGAVDVVGDGDRAPHAEGAGEGEGDDGDRRVAGQGDGHGREAVGHVVAGDVGEGAVVGREDVVVGEDRHGRAGGEVGAGAGQGVDGDDVEGGDDGGEDEQPEPGEGEGAADAGDGAAECRGPVFVDPTDGALAAVTVPGVPAAGRGGVPAGGRMTVGSCAVGSWVGHASSEGVGQVRSGGGRGGPAGRVVGDGRSGRAPRSTGMCDHLTRGLRRRCITVVPPPGAPGAVPAGVRRCRAAPGRG